MAIFSHKWLILWLKNYILINLRLIPRRARRQGKKKLCNDKSWISILNIIYICTGIVDYTFVKVSINVIDFELTSLEECC